MLCGVTVAVCCENCTEHTDTVRTSQETRHVSTTEPNRLMLCGVTVAVYCKNHTEHIQCAVCGQLLITAFRSLVRLQEVLLSNLFPETPVHIHSNSWFTR
jgi:hypothetical protein